MLDTFQRYLEAYNLIALSSHSHTKLKVLDVGSNGPGIANYIKEFKNVELTNIDIQAFDRKDIENFPEVNFVTYKPGKIPFNTSSYDIVLCIDTYEHIQGALRASFIEEVLRVTKEYCIFSFPVDTSRNYEKILRSVFRNKIKFLNEHNEYGLPNAKEFKKLVESQNFRINKEIDNINLFLWIPVKLLSSLIYKFIKHKPNLISKCFMIYKSGIFRLFNFGKGYSKTFLIKKLNPHTVSNEHKYRS